MYITNVKVDNYKSFGKQHNVLNVDRRKTAIIGVNESGKSNLLELIGNLNFITALSDYYDGIKNLNYNNEDCSLEVGLKFEENERDKLGIVNDQGTILRFSRENFATIEGELSAVIKNDSEINEVISLFESAKGIGDVDAKSSNLAQFDNALNNLKNASKKLIRREQLNALTDNIRAGANVELYKEKVKEVKNRLSLYYSMLPIVVFRNTKDMTEVKSHYNENEVVQDLKNTKSPLSLLIKAAGVDLDDMQRAISLPSTNERSTLRHKIEKKIQNNVCAEFAKFYQNNDYELEIKFEEKSFYIRVITGENSLYISERSNGFRWFFGLFLQVASQDYVNRNIVYVLDEPGVFLHINAQKELLSLFDELTGNKGQVIYSTHLPTMIDIDNLQSIRRIEKDEQGNSHIFNKFYGNGINETSKEDTLAPLLQAMGCEYGDVNFTDHRLNIVTEGPTDKYYLEAGMTILNIPSESRPHIIAAQGASNISNVMAILLGWGCDCIALFDYDKAGVKAYRSMLKAYGDEIREHLRFVVGADISSKVYENNPKTIESIISDTLNKKLPTPYDGKNETKTIAALSFKNMICNCDLKADTETENNYRNLFRRLGII